MEDKKLDGLWRRQAAYAASRRRIADAQMAIVENKRLGVSDPSRDALLADYQEALNHLLEIGDLRPLASTGSGAERGSGRVADSAAAVFRFFPST